MLLVRIAISACCAALFSLTSPAGAVVCASDDAPAVAPAKAADERPVGELARFTTTDKIQLDATFHPVPKAKEPVPAVLLVHDLGADQQQLEALVDKLLKKKVAVLTFDLRGHGVNKNETFDWSALDEAGRAALAPYMVNDVMAAVNWLAADARVQGNHLHVVGQGFGALLALRAARDERVVSVTLSQPAEDLHGLTLRTLLPNAEGLAAQILTTTENEKRFATMLEEADLTKDIALVSVKAEEFSWSDKKLSASFVKWIDENRAGRPVERVRG
jgi:alpha-beta hydrolase superfamily lysophospholipase